MPQLVRILGLCSLFLFSLLSLLFLWSGISRTLHASVHAAFSRLSFSTQDSQVYFEAFPDFGQHVPLRTISKVELDLEHRRLIIVGDIHGMKSSVAKLLNTLSYTSSDLLVHVGDTIAKGPDSLKTLQQFVDANVTGVRGNHEQKVIEWRGWIEWVENQKGGKQLLDEMEHYESRGVHAWKETSRHHNRKFTIPKGWKFMSEHYRIARSLTISQYTYLKGLPLVIHLPSLHTHIVHAGILPFDPKLPPTSSKQPLGHAPKESASQLTELMRTAQERALLTDINPNTDPWVLLNMRSVLGNDRISRKSKQGTPWSELWDMIMKRCGGYNQGSITVEGHADTTAAFRLPCMPINIVYGHAAGRGLDVKRWSFGLDTGCVYGRNLTAMVITDANTPIDVLNAQTQEVPFGDHGSAHITSIACT